MTRSATAVLRAQGSDGERAFETGLRRRGVPAWIRELVFAPGRRYRFDFAWPDLMVAVEIEGGTWIAGRHSRGSGFAADCRKYNDAAERGWAVLRFTTERGWDVDEAVQMLVRTLYAASQRRPS
jgi:very-short-patch-repair endonuclease